MKIQRLVFFGLVTLVPVSAQSFGQIFTSSFRPPSIEGAPFSAIWITERDQRVGAPKQDDMWVYRDSAGRTRIDSGPHDSARKPDFLTIVDPVEGYRYEVHEYGKVIRRFALPARRPEPLPQLSPGIVPDPENVGVLYTRRIFDGAVQGIGLAGDRFKSTAEFFGPVEVAPGVSAKGARVTTTLEAGTVGNDDELVVIDERWSSPQLRVLVAERMSDPRFGDTIRRLTNIKVGEPDPALFVLPAGYAIEDMPAPAY